MDITLTDDEWDSKYAPISNHISGYNEYDQLFETYGADLDFVRKHRRNHIWTQVDDGNGGVYIINGYHLVNRIGYYITKNPHDLGDNISVCVISAEEEAMMNA